jgi:hypothetical protein
MLKRKLEAQAASLDKLAKLIHVTALLLRSKVYLFWKNEPVLSFTEFLKESSLTN